MPIEVINFRGFERNTLKGFLAVRLSNIGWEMRDIALHEKNESRWLQMPSLPYEKDGEQKYAYEVKRDSINSSKT